MIDWLWDCRPNAEIPIEASYGIFSMALLGMGFSSLLYAIPAIILLYLLVHTPKLNWGLILALPLLPIAVSSEVEGDSTMYDIPFAMRMMQNHGITFTPDIFAGMWMNQADLFLSVAPEMGRVISCGCVVACSVILYDMIERTDSKRLAWLAPVIVFCAPGMMKVCASSKYDATALLFSFLAASEFQRGNNFKSGLAIGLSCVCKVTAIPILAGLVLFGGWRIIAGASISLIPWMIRQWLVMGNPLFPMMGSVFSENFFCPQRQREMARGLTSRTPLATITANYVWLSPVSSVFFPFSLGGSMAWVGVIGVAGVAFTLSSEPRYLLPCLPFIAVPAMATAEAMTKKMGGFMLYAVIGIILAIPSYKQWLFQPGIPKSYTEMKGICQNARVLGWGEERNYPDHSPNFRSANYTAPPFFWKLSLDSDTPRRMRVRIKQMRREYLLVNPTSLVANNVYSGGYLWGKKQLDRYKEFNRKYLKHTWSGKVGDWGGNYEIYEFTGLR